MPLRRYKPGYFVLEGMNSFAAVYYSYYFFFYMQQVFGYGNRANLALAAANGAVYMVFAWLGGKFAQRFGCFQSLKLGFGVMIAALAAGLFLASAPGQILVMLFTFIGVCFTWPALEALVSEGETAIGLPRMVGIYNMVWAGTAAVANFVGGAVLQNLGLKSLFYVPIAILVGQFALTLWLEAKARAEGERPVPTPATKPAVVDLEQGMNHRSAEKAKTFLMLAWLANPFAYVAINTIVAAVPGVARRLELSTMLAGFCCSIWCFSRLAAFFVLWRWVGWHFKFRWLLLSYVLLIASFAAVLMAPSLAVLVAAQIVFGAVAGLIYYSSLFYSMDVGEATSEHGGIHEAAIGLGNFAGPSVGAASLYLLPSYANSGILAVSGLLCLGLAGLLAIWHLGTRRNSQKPLQKLPG
jgi:predicted MFS family arabinose efflux permease